MENTGGGVLRHQQRVCRLGDKRVEFYDPRATVATGAVGRWRDDNHRWPLVQYYCGCRSEVSAGLQACTDEHELELRELDHQPERERAVHDAD